mmetsp:Transcript_104468/g.185828  ORF Transcript_104468/g.185828 Transcript_104468/m.185828 type:complete len:100 (+) Transcript_104468:1242-1541(+)
MRRGCSESWDLFAESCNPILEPGLAARKRSFDAAQHSSASLMETVGEELELDPAGLQWGEVTFAPAVLLVEALEQMTHMRSSGLLPETCNQMLPSVQVA